MLRHLQNARFFMIRVAGCSDVPDIVRLGIDGLNAYPVEHQRIDVEKLQEVARTCVLGPNNFAWIAVHEGKTVGALCALVMPQSVYQRKCASCVQFWCPQAGEGIKLIREFRDWASEQRSIKAVMFTLEAGADPRIGDLLEKAGFEIQKHPVYVQWK